MVHGVLANEDLGSAAEIHACLMERQACPHPAGYLLLTSRHGFKMTKGALPKKEMLVYIQKMQEASVLASNPIKQTCLLWPRTENKAWKMA